MNDNGENQSGYIVDQSKLPINFPTHLHKAEFWEALGRAIATFGFLEDTLVRAIFALTATKPYNEDEIRVACDEWLKKLDRTLTDQLGSLINSYEKAVREHPQATITNFDELLEELRKASKIRNVLVHGCWLPPNSSGASVPRFINRQKEVFKTPIDIDYLNRVQRNAKGLAFFIVETVTYMGYQFPGSLGPGKGIFEKK